MTLILLAVVGDSSIFVQTFPLSVCVLLFCILKKKCSLQSRPFLGAVFVRCNVCDINILLCFLQDYFVQFQWTEKKKMLQIQYTLIRCNLSEMVNDLTGSSYMVTLLL